MSHFTGCPNKINALSHFILKVRTLGKAFGIVTPALVVSTVAKKDLEISPVTKKKPEDETSAYKSPTPFDALKKGLRPFDIS